MLGNFGAKRNLYFIFSFLLPPVQKIVPAPLCKLRNLGPNLAQSFYQSSAINDSTVYFLRFE